MKIQFHIVALILTLPAISSADWEGNFKTTITGGKNVPEVSGVMRMKKELMRIDATTPATISTIVNLKSKKAWTLLHHQKMTMETNLSTVEAQTPVCGSVNIDECLKTKGFKKTGTETANGYPCTVYEADITGADKKTSHIKMWRPNSLKEVPSVKSVITSTGGNTAETNFSNIKTTPQADSLFAAPKNYQSMGNPQDLLKGLGKGMGGFKIPTGK